MRRSQVTGHVDIALVPDTFLTFTYDFSKFEASQVLHLDPYHPRVDSLLS